MENKKQVYEAPAVEIKLTENDDVILFSMEETGKAEEVTWCW